MRAFTVEELDDLAGAPRDEAIRGAVEALQTAEHDVYARAVEILRALDPEPELRAMLDERPMLVLDAVAAIGADDLLPEVSQLAREAASPAVRTLAVQAVGTLAGPDNEELLVGALEDPAPSVRGTAALELARVGSVAAAEAVRRAAEAEQDQTAQVLMNDALDLLRTAH